MRHQRFCRFGLVLTIGGACASNPTWAQEEHDLAKQLANPIASLISLPFQSNWDTHIGPARDGDAGLRYWAENPDTGAHDFGARFNIIFLFPTAK